MLCLAGMLAPTRCAACPPVVLRTPTLTVHGGSSPMGSQANRLMGCVFHPSGLAPEGGAPAYRTLHASPGERGSENKTLAQAHGTPSKARSCWYPWERLTTEPANSIELARCNVSYQLFSHTRAEPAMPTDLWLKPQRLTARAQALRRAAGESPFSVSAWRVAIWQLIMHYRISDCPPALRHLLQTTRDSAGAAATSWLLQKWGQKAPGLSRAMHGLPLDTCRTRVLL
jgi:hypothetical protein